MPNLQRSLACLLAVFAVTIGATPPAHADEWRDKQWHLDFLKVDEVHTITEGKGVTVAVIDTGVDGSHPDLKGNVLKGRDFTGNDPWHDTAGHGTAMASLIAGHGHGPERRDGVLGLAPMARILPIRTITGDAETDTDNPHAAEGFRWAGVEGAGVVSFSGAAGGLRDAVSAALESDAVVVSAAGNAVQGDVEVKPPASYPGVIAVSGVDRNGRFTDQSAQGPEIVLAAPAVDIAGAWAGKRGQYGVGTGTSGSTALVSATAALVRARYPDLSANGVINRLIKTADDKGPPGRDPKYGFGVVNPLKALTADIPDIDYNPLLKRTPSPNGSSAKAANAGDNTDEGGGYLIPVLVILGGVIALALVASGAYLISRPKARSW